MIGIEYILLGVGILLFISVILSRVTSLLDIPTLILFLLIGLFLDLTAVFEPSIQNYTTIQNISIFVLIIIMFSGGLDTDIKKMKPIASIGVSLSTFGVLITAFVTGLFIHFIIGFDLILSFLIGSVVSSTDAAAVFSIFKSGEIKLKDDLSNILELESATNDPMAYILTITFLFLMLHPTTSILNAILMFIQSLALGSIIGYLSGKMSSKLVEKVNLDIDGLYPVLLISLAILTFSCAELIGANGFLAVYIAALLIGNSKIPNKESQISFFDGMGWLTQIIMFIVLGLFVFPEQLLKTGGISLAITFAMIFISRPVAVFTSLIPFKVKLKNKIFISWTGIKGAVPIVFATYPLVAGIPEAPVIFNIVFFITIISVITKGTTLKTVAKKLNLLA
ncbi:MAG: potassium/proton antiporter [Methanobacteriaceae archaeon]|jgi:cell volume regulation protein A|nr:potassium/proton antiporter [Candidatus Methanorudis spinitermitis]